jgi:hypothetical protein
VFFVAFASSKVRVKGDDVLRNDDNLQATGLAGSEEALVWSHAVHITVGRTSTDGKGGGMCLIVFPSFSFVNSTNNVGDNRTRLKKTVCQQLILFKRNSNHAATHCLPRRRRAVHRQRCPSFLTPTSYLPMTTTKRTSLIIDAKQWHLPPSLLSRSF